MRHRILHLMCVVMCVGVLMIAAYAQQSHWATPDDKTAKFMIDMERKWAEGVCTNNGVISELLADDFQGTSTRGERYNKADELRDEKGPHSARACALDDGRVRFFSSSSSAKMWPSFTAASTPSAKTKRIQTRSSARSGPIPG
jgi:hypothetical protein